METENKSNGTEILSQIRNSEKKADEIIENGIKQKESMLQDAIKSSSELLNKRKEEIEKLGEKKIVNSRTKAESDKNDKLKEGKKKVDHITVKFIKSVKSEKGTYKFNEKFVRLDNISKITELK